MKAIFSFMININYKKIVNILMIVQFMYVINF